MALPWDFSVLDKKKYKVAKDSITDIETGLITPCKSNTGVIQLFLSERIKIFFNIYSVGTHRGYDGKDTKILHPLYHKSNNLNELYPIDEYEDYNNYELEIKTILIQKYLCQVSGNTLNNISLITINNKVKIISSNEATSVRRCQFIMVKRIKDEYFPGPHGLSDGLAEVLGVTDETSYLETLDNLDEEMDILREELKRCNNKSFLDTFYNEFRRLLDDFYDRLPPEKKG